MASEDKRWAEFDHRMKQAEKRILTTANLVRAGVPMLVDMQARLDALIDSDTRLYGRLQQLTEAQIKTDEKITRLVELQAQTEKSLKAFIASMKSGRNGKH